MTDWFRPLFGLKARGEIDVYQMPEPMGGDWAWAAAGTISDGYASEDDALAAALVYLASVPDEGKDA